jgi:hypothetical protein
MSHNGGMKKHSQKTRLARLDAQQNEKKCSKTKGKSALYWPVMHDTDFRMMKWLNSLNPEDLALYDSQFAPSPPPREGETPRARYRTFLEPIHLQPHKTDPPPDSAAGKELAQRRKAMEARHRRAAVMRRVDARLQHFIAAMPAEEQHEMRHGWKKTIRPYKKPE